MNEQMGDRYQLIEKLGTGGMATVWKAFDQTLNRPVAIKRLLPHLASDPVVAERFRNEAIAVANLSHPGIVSVFDTGVDEEGPYMVLELVAGDTLANRLAGEGVLPLSTTAGIVAQVAEALDYAHGQGIVHRDIKPANLIIDTDGKVHLADFGIALSLSDTTSITRPGELAGTLLYIAPEIVEGGRATAASDIYSLAAMTVEMLTGKPPYEADNVGALLAKIREGDVTAFAVGLPDDVVPTITAAMSTDPGTRPPTAGRFASSLLTNTTIVMPAGEVPGAVGASPSEATTVLLPRPSAETKPSRGMAVARKERARKTRSSDRRSKAVPIVIGMLLLGALIVTAVALSSDGAAVPNVTTTTAVVVGETTTTTTTTTPSTTTSTTLAPEPTPDTVATEISMHLDELNAPNFKPKDVKRVRERLDDLMKSWSEGDREEVEERFKKFVESIDDLPDSPERGHLSEHALQLAGLLGLDFEAND